jgi:hypothetical protein
MSPSAFYHLLFFNQVATVPSVMVSLKRGIVTTTTPFGNAADLLVLRLVLFFFGASSVDFF